ncbi:hypothetical protein BZG29_15515 [Janthinobacterium sp. LM6]|nr:hypothetical protein BZG29_15515 [Janthinobacterium sp. LM6]
MTLDEKRQIAEIEKLKVERLKTMGALGVGAGSALGVAAIFTYCFFVIGFFPTGLSLGDSLFFIFIALGFSITGAMLAGFGFMAYVPWVMQKPKATGGLKSSNYIIAIFIFSSIGFYISYLLFEDIFTDADKDYIWCLYIISPLIIVAFICIAYRLVEDFSAAIFYSIPWLIFTLSTGLIVVGVIIDNKENSNQILLASLIILVSGFLLALGISVLSDPTPVVAGAPPPKNRLSVSLILIFIAVLLPYIAAATGSHLFNYVLGRLGLQVDSILIVNKSNLLVLQASADTEGMPLYSCKMDSDSFSVSNVRVLWHGIGVRSYIELKDMDNLPKESVTQKREGIRVELDSAGVKISRGGKAGSCAEFKNGIYFDSGKDVFVNDQSSLSTLSIKNFLQSMKAKERKIIIVGYADPMPRGKEGNFSLAQARACTVFKQLEKDDLIDAPGALIDVRLDRDGISTCSDMKDAGKQRACFEQSRRVELQVVNDGSTFFRMGTAVAAQVCDESKKMEQAKRLKP